MPRRKSRDPDSEQYIYQLTDVDRMRVRFVLDRGVPGDMTVQLECWLRGRWVPARRYDNSGGVFHVHPMPWDRESDRHVYVSTSGPKDALNLAVDDLKRNWPTYRAACEAAYEASRVEGEHEV
jgi:hypothetical protein